jgi:hypothetical protein
MNNNSPVLSSRIIAYLLDSVLAMISVVVYMAHASEPSDGGVAPLFGLELPPGYRDWRLISVAHEAGKKQRFARDSREPILRCRREPVKARDFVFTRYSP